MLASRSEYFKSMLTSGFRECESEEPILIRDTTPDAFHALLRYIYTDEFLFDNLEILHALHLYGRVFV